MSRKIVAGILAHVDAGKTTLSESLLYETGVIKKIGRVDTKDAYLDTNCIERQRGITIYSKNARIPMKDYEMILVDTPGHVDFSTEMERTLRILDVAILIISGSSKVQSHTKTLWNLLKMYKIPTFIFVNKMDMQGTDKDEILDDIHEKLTDMAVDFSVPDTEEFYENIATSNEEMLEYFLNNSMIRDEDICSSIYKRQTFPVFFGSALKQEGIKEFVAGLNRYITPAATSSDASSDEFSGIVYKISRDEAGKRLTFIKILSGKLEVKAMLGDEKINEIRIYSGEKYESVKICEAGDICAIVGLTKTVSGQTFGTVKTVNKSVLCPALNYAVFYPDDVDKNKMLGILKELEDEDPALNVEYREETGEIFVSLMGDVLMEVLKQTISDRYKIDVSFGEGKICYKETIDATAIGVGHFEPLRHYAEVLLMLEPAERGEGLVFASDVSEDLLDKNWQHLILTHLKEREHKGVLKRSPITDMKITLVAGRAHVKHTEGGDFRQATYRAIRQGLMKLLVTGNCRLLEPFYEYTLELPETYVGRAMTDITSMSGTCVIADNDYANHTTILTGKAPVSTMNGYMKEVAAYTKGLGNLTVNVSGYELCHNEEEILANTSYNPENDKANPCGSVFCMHGAGTVVPWDEVDEYKHLAYEEGTIVNVNDEEQKTINEALNKQRRLRDSKGNDEALISIDEIDKILKQSTHANENGRKNAYKGISNATVQRRYAEKNTMKVESKPYVYKGTKRKEKCILVDGYNVIHAWDELKNLAKISLDSANGTLNDILSNYQAMVGSKLIVVYDAYKIKGHATEENQYNNITVVYTKQDMTADAYIERFAHDNSKNYEITVVTSDNLERAITFGDGCSIIASNDFYQIVETTKKNFNELHGVNSE